MCRGNNLTVVTLYYIDIIKPQEKPGCSALASICFLPLHITLIALSMHRPYSASYYVLTPSLSRTWTLAKFYVSSPHHGCLPSVTWAFKGGHRSKKQQLPFIENSSCGRSYAKHFNFTISFNLYYIYEFITRIISILAMEEIKLQSLFKVKKVLGGAFIWTKSPICSIIITAEGEYIIIFLQVLR